MYQFTTFTKKVSFYDYVNSLSTNEINQKIRLLYNTVKGSCKKDIKIGGLLGTRYATFLMLFDYCNKCLPFDSQKYTDSAVQISIVLSFLFCVIPCAHGSAFEDKVLSIFEEQIRLLRQNSVINGVEFDRVKNLIDDKVGGENYIFYKKWESFPTDIELQIQNIYENSMNETDCYNKIGLGLFGR